MDTVRELTEALAALLRREHDALADFLVALADFDGRRLWAELGYPSLFYFLHRELHLSLGAAQYRKVAAELIQEVPAVVEPLRDGRMCMTSIIEAAKVVTAENWEAVLPRFYGLSRREALEVVAALQPHPAPPVRTVITSARSVVSEFPPMPAPSLEGTPQEESPFAATSPGEMIPVASWEAPASRPAELVPLTATLDRLHVTISKRFARKLEQAADAHPDLATEDLLEAGLDLLLQKAAKRKGIVAKPLTNPRPSKNDDHIPAHVKREVMKRDGGRCQWLLPDGEICGCTRHLQFDHIIPRALGGKSTADNIRLLCASHNLEAARRVLGDEVMDRYAGPNRKRRPRGNTPEERSSPT